jgi:tetratricopeptide (TPR) repeat protein
MSELNHEKYLLGIGDRKRAIKELFFKLKNNPNNVDAWSLLAEVVYENEKKADCYRQILRIDPSNKLAQELLANIVKGKNVKQVKDLNEKTKKSQTVSSNSKHVITNSKSSLYKQPIEIVNVKTKTSGFKPKYITILAELGIIFGALLPWVLSSYGDITITDIGLETIPGLATFAIGLIILYTTIFIESKNGKNLALISSTIAFISFIILMIWARSNYYASVYCALSIPMKGEIFHEHPECVFIRTGVGYRFSMFFLLVTIISGLIKNPSFVEMKK